jgi:Arc/MetJ-type ribon-helix-helix transcriptional regulator
MSYPFPPALDRLVQEELATGAYRSEDDVLVEALQALRDRDEAIAGIREGLSDWGAGRVHSLNDVDMELRTMHGIARNA